MKKYLFLTLGLLAFGCAESQAQVITGFASPGLNQITSSNLSAVLGDGNWAGAGSLTPTLNPTALTVTTVANAGGADIYQTLSTPIPDSAAAMNYLTLEGSLVSTGPNFSSGAFTITLYDSSFNQLVYNFNYTSFGSAETSVYAGLDRGISSAAFNGTISSWELDGGGQPSDVITFNFDQLSEAPEPSTYAMLGFGLVLLYGVARRKARQA